MAKCAYCGLERNDISTHELVCAIAQERDAALLRCIAAESRLDAIHLGLSNVLVRNGIGKVSNADAMSELHELFYQWFQRKDVERQEHIGREPGPREIGGKPAYLVDKRE